MTDISGNSRNITNSLFTIINEMLNDLDDNDIEDVNHLNPLLRRNRNSTIGGISRIINQTSPLFNTINEIFDVSRNRRQNININNENNENNENDDNNQNNPIVEEITFHITYPNLRYGNQDNTSENNDNINNENNDNINNENSNNSNNNSHNSNNFDNFGNIIDNFINATINNGFDNALNNQHLTTRRYYSPINAPYNTHYNRNTNLFGSSNILQEILNSSLYDVTAYKKKISEKGKSQLIHIRFDKNDNENINTSCPIMQTDFEDEQYVIKLPCNHMFTPEAINKWLEEKPECPVCRFELDSIEVKRENNTQTSQNNSFTLHNRRPNFFRTNIANQTTLIRQPNNMSYLPTRQIGSDITELNNSYLDYLYEEMDNADFQTAIMLSYREMIDNSNQVSTSSANDRYITDDENETNTISNTQLRDNVDNRNDIEDDEIYNQSYSDMNESLTEFIIDNSRDYNDNDCISEITNCSDDDAEHDTIENYTEDDETCDDVSVVSIDSED